MYACINSDRQEWFGWTFQTPLALPLRLIPGISFLIPRGNSPVFGYFKNEFSEILRMF